MAEFHTKNETKGTILKEKRQWVFSVFNIIIIDAGFKVFHLMEKTLYWGINKDTKSV